MRSLLLFLIFLLLAFPLFYFVYKFGDPDQISHDFYHYYALYDQFDLIKTKPPFNMRFIGAFFIYLLYQSGIYYNTDTRFDDYALYMKEEVWFAAVFFNFLMVATTATLIAKVYTRYFETNTPKQPLNAVLAGTVYLMGYGTMFFDLMPVTEAFSTCLFVIMLGLFLKRSYWLLPVLLLCVFQREFLLLLILLLPWLYRPGYFERFDRLVTITAVALFIAYFVIRSTWFYNPELHHQTNLGAMLYQMQSLGVSTMVMLRQSLISLNLLLIYALVVAFKYWTTGTYYRKGARLILAILVVAFGVTLAGGLGTNFGRMFYLATPLVACLLVKEAASLTTVSGQPTKN
jgi:hypothetical protein